MEEYYTTDPFICVEVDEKSKLNYLANQFNTFFPNRIVRLKINNEYSPFFYLGNNKWQYKRKPKKKSKIFSVKTYLNENVFDFIEENQLALFQMIEVDPLNLKLVSDTILCDKEIDGIFFTDGTYIIIDQCLINESETLKKFFIEKFNCEIVLDLSNIDDTGMMIVKTDIDIFGLKK